MTREQKRALFTILLLGLILLLLTACGSDGPSEGYVRSHEYDDPDDVWVPGYTIPGSESCTGGYNGQPRICTRSPSIYIPGRYDHHPARYILHLEKDETDDKGKTKTRSGTCVVERETYESVRDGQYFNCKTGQVVSK